MRIKHVVTALLLLGVPALGLAAVDGSLDASNRVPEPETLVLLAAGGGCLDDCALDQAQVILARRDAPAPPR